MKSKLYLFDAPISPTVTPTQVMGYLFCPRFTYFEECLKIPEHEEKRFKVLMGREVHEKKAHENVDYLRKRVGAIDKKIAVYLVGHETPARGIVDEILWLADGTLAPLEYKFTEYRAYFFKTHRCQLAIQALLIRENFQKPVTRGFLVYTRSNNRLEEIVFRERDFTLAQQTIERILDIIESGYYPTVRQNINKCVDCCYRNICV